MFGFGPEFVKTRRRGMLATLVVSRISARMSAPSPNSSTGHLDARVARAVSFVRLHHADPDLALRHVASVMDVSSAYASRLLKASTGWGFVRMLHDARIPAACGLLTDTTLLIKQVAWSVGYLRTTELDRHFNTRKGLSPRSYRQQSSSHRTADKK